MLPSLANRITELHRGDQVCSICADKAEQLKVLAPFVRDGLARGEQCVISTSTLSPEDVLHSLEQLDFLTENTVESGSLVFVHSEEPSLESSLSTPARRIECMASLEAKALRGGFSGIRFVDHMDWLLSDGIQRESVIEYGIGLSRYLPTSQAIVLCQYCEPLHDPAVIHDAIRTNPILYLNADACPNLYYEPIEILLDNSPEKSSEFKRTRVRWWIRLLKQVQADDRHRDLLQDQVRQVQKQDAVGQLAGGIAHDFNNLLSIIIGYSDLLLHDHPVEGRTHDMLLEIKEATNRSIDLTRQLLAFSRKQMIAPTLLVLNSVILDFHRMLVRIIGEDVQMSLSLDEALGAVRVDRSQIEQVLMNLTVNARDAMPNGGRLSIETRNIELDSEYALNHLDVSPGRYVMLSVTDTGPGIPEEILARIFDPFFTTKPQGRGTGLGLAVAQGIVVQSGGRILVYSELGIGTTFKIYLPRVDHLHTEPESGAISNTPPTGSETVLLVEDDRALRAYSREVISGLGYDVIDAPDGAEAIQLAASLDQSIDLLVTDVVMPGINGPQLVDHFANARPTMKVLYLSGYTDDTVVRHGILEKEVNFLQKPFTPLALATAIRRAIDHPSPSKSGSEEKE